jgi:hypothetical protein
MEKKLYDEAFYVHKKDYGLWYSVDKEDKGLVTALTEEACVRATRFYLKLKQDEKNGIMVETKTYSREVGGKL